MSTIYEEYIPCIGEGVNRIAVRLYYDKGGQNYFNGQNDSRGYYLVVTPVEVVKCNGYTRETSTAFSGARKLVKAVSRKSSTSEGDALRVMRDVKQELIDYVCKTNGIKLE